MSERTEEIAGLIRAHRVLVEVMKSRHSRGWFGHWRRAIEIEVLSQLSNRLFDEISERQNERLQERA